MGPFMQKTDNKRGEDDALLRVQSTLLSGMGHRVMGDE
jgi:hypothetical protein